jgi:C1A family cysteine protease
MPSRMYIYWFTRVRLGEQQWDSGGSVADTMQAVIDAGYCYESDWQYVDANLFVQPPPAIIKDGRSRQIEAPIPVSGLQGIKRALARGQPVAFGLWLYNSFFEADLNGGLVPMPDTSGANQKHAGLLVGYDDVRQRLVMRNSWGVQTPEGRPCGDNGYYYLPYAYIVPHLATDFWTTPRVIDPAGV